MSIFPYSPYSDLNDDEPWSEADIRDLENHIRQGASLEETAEFPVPWWNRGSRGRKSETTWPDLPTSAQSAPPN